MHLSFPIYFEFGGHKILAHFVFEVLAYVAAFALYQWQRKKTEEPVFPIPSTQRAIIMVMGGLGALLGAKGLAYLEHYQINQTLPFAMIIEEKTVLGGLLGGLLMIELTKFVMGIRRSMGDDFCYPLILGIMIGRVGCLSAGIYDGTHGSQTSLPWGMDLGDGIPRHPTALYEILFLGLLWMGLHTLKQRQFLKPGGQFALFMLAYTLWRLFIEFIKPVDRLPDIGLSAIQVAAAAGALYYAAVIFHRQIFERKIYGQP